MKVRHLKLRRRVRRQRKYSSAAVAIRAWWLEVDRMMTSPAWVRMTEDFFRQALAHPALATEQVPTNPATGQPYFTIPAEGWGSGWSVAKV